MLPIKIEILRGIAGFRGFVIRTNATQQNYLKIPQ